MRPNAIRFLQVFGIVGAAVGLIVGVFVHPATAPFAAVEIGLPAAVLGLLVGLAVDGLVGLRRRAGPGNAPSAS